MAKQEPYITGHYGCNCHPFASWKECDKAHKQKFKIGDYVKHRCSSTPGIITEILGRHFYCIQTNGTRFSGLQHAANLIPYKMAKKQTKTKTKTEAPAYTLLLKFNAAEKKQLEVAKKITGEVTATKAIIKCMYNAEYYMKQYQEQRNRIDALEAQLNRNVDALQRFVAALKEVHEVAAAKQNAGQSPDKQRTNGKKGLQLLIE